MMKIDRSLKNMIAALGVFLIAGFPMRAGAETAAELQAQIQELTRQVMKLRAQLSVHASAPAQFSRNEFSRDLTYGSRGDDVIRLQEFLIAQGYLAPGLATGNFYTRTYEALKRYQAESSIAETGYFDSITREKVNADHAANSNRTSFDAPLDTAQGKFQDAGNLSRLSSDGAAKATLPPSTVPARISTATALEETDKPFVIEPGYTILPKPRYAISDLEQLIQTLINRERTSRGFDPLLWSSALADAAHLHSQDQAKDNAVITAVPKPCSYPYIRHEGFLFGLHLADRLKSRGISYAIAGENIAAFSVGKSFLYRYSSNQSPILCPALILPSSGLVGESQAEARARVAADVGQLAELITAIPDVTWIQKQWLMSSEIAEEIVKGWMNSLGHRKNALDARFIQGGVGISMVNDYVIATHLLMKGF